MFMLTDTVTLPSSVNQVGQKDEDFLQTGQPEDTKESSKMLLSTSLYSTPPLYSVTT